MKRIFLIVLDSFGIGEMPDAANYGDEGSNTLGTVAKSPEFSMPNMAKLGLFNIDGVTAKTPCAKPEGRLLVHPVTIHGHPDAMIFPWSRHRIRCWMC